MQDNANKSSFFLNSKSEVQKFILSNTGKLYMTRYKLRGHDQILHEGYILQFSQFMYTLMYYAISASKGKPVKLDL